MSGDDPRVAWVSAITIGLLAVLLVGGGVAATLLRIPLPEWMATAIGMVILAAFGHGAFFAVARAAGPQAQHLADLRAKYHELATWAMRSVSRMATEATASNGGEQ